MLPQCCISMVTLHENNSCNYMQWFGCEDRFQYHFLLSRAQHCISATNSAACPIYLCGIKNKRIPCSHHAAFQWLLYMKIIPAIICSGLAVKTGFNIIFYFLEHNTTYLLPIPQPAQYIFVT